MLRRIGRFFDRVPAVAYVAIGCASLALFLWVQASGNFPDPDSFYHGRMAMLIAERGPIHDFPWLAKTVFADSYVDHHFLYHVLLIPFVKLAPTIADGLRVSAIAFAVLTVLAGAWLLRSLGVGKVAFLAPLLFLVSNPLVFRLDLAKTPAVSLLALFVGFHAAARRKPLLLGTVAFLYVWLYDGWIILPVLVSFVVLADVLTPERPGTHTEERGWHWRDRVFGTRTRALLGATALGLVLGHALNPSFPENLSFEWLHIVRIGFVGFRDAIGVGAEWYPYASQDLLAATSTTFLAAFLGLVAWFVAWMRSRETGAPLPRERVRETAALFLFATLACVFAMRSRRNVEYFVPFAILAAVSAFDLFVRARAWETFPLVGKGRRLTTALALLALVWCGVTLPVVAIRDLKGVRQDFDRGIPPTRYAGVSAWLDRNVPEGTLVWHDDWDDFPYFFLHTTHERWMVGLDPTFWYVKDPATFQEWVGITRSTILDDLPDRIVRDFGSRYAWVDKDHPTLYASFASEPRMVQVYQDADGWLFGIRDASMR